MPILGKDAVALPVGQKYCLYIMNFSCVSPQLGTIAGLDRHILYGGSCSPLGAYVSACLNGFDTGSVLGLPIIHLLVEQLSPLYCYHSKLDPGGQLARISFHFRCNVSY